MFPLGQKCVISQKDMAYYLVAHRSKTFQVHHWSNTAPQTSWTWTRVECAGNCPKGPGISKNLKCLGKSSPCKTCELPLSASFFACVNAHTHTRHLGALPLGLLRVVLAIVVPRPGLFESSILDLGKGAALFLRRGSPRGLPVHAVMRHWKRIQKQMQRNRPAAGALHGPAGGAGQGQSAGRGAAMSVVREVTLRVSSNQYRRPGAPLQTVCVEHNWMEA